MGLWTFYFLLKLYLHYRGYVRLDVLLNLLLLLFVALPLPQQLRERRSAAILRQSLALSAGTLLFWSESWLPAPLHAVAMLRQNGMPSREYLYQFFLRLWGPTETAILLFLATASVLLRRHRTGVAAATAVLLLLPLVLSAGAQGRRSPAEINHALQTFINSESMRVIRPVPPPSEDRAFDLLVLQICSLGWDDLRELGMEDHPFFKQFDLLFTNFNSVSTYSNPSAIRLLNGNCGQRRHADLYAGLPAECSVMGGLRRQGFVVRYARNHNGVYGKFDSEVRTLGRLDAPAFEPTALEAKKYMFDDSPVYDDYAVLEQWWKARTRSADRKVALYYSSVSLHDGSHWVSDREWWKRGHKEQYREFLTTLLDDLDRFLGSLAASGRDVVVIVAGEHGRALRGNAIETPGLRDIPLPRITIVPVGIKMIGAGRAAASSDRQMIIGKPAGYFGLAYVIEAFGEHSPFSTDRYATRAFIDSIPQTAFVAENESNLVIRTDDEYYLYGKDRKWLYLSQEALK